MRSNERHVLGARLLLRRLVVEPVDVGQQHQQIGAHHGGDARGQPVVVAVADFARGRRVVLVDHRHAAPFQQLGDGRARIEIAAALLGIAQCDQHLAGGELVRPERLGPGARQRDLPDGGGGLRLLELEAAGGQLQHGAAERDGAGRDHQHVALLGVQGGDVGGELVEPGALEPPAAASTSSDEPTLTTMRRKSLSDGVLGMVPAGAC